MLLAVNHPLGFGDTDRQYLKTWDCLQGGIVFFRYYFCVNRRVLTLALERQNRDELDLWKRIVNLFPLVSDRKQRASHTAKQEEQKDWD